MSDLMSEHDVGKYIQEKILSAKKRGETEITLISGDIQKELFCRTGWRRSALPCKSWPSRGMKFCAAPRACAQRALPLNIICEPHYKKKEPL